MKYLGHLLTLIGAAVVALGVTGPWLHFDELGLTAYGVTDMAPASGVVSASGSDNRIVLETTGEAGGSEVTVHVTSATKPPGQSVSVSDGVIQIAVGEAGLRAADVHEALEGHADASKLVTATLEGDGTGKVYASDAQVLEPLAVGYPGQLAFGFAVFAVLLTILAIVLQRRVLVISESLTSLAILGMLAWAYFDNFDVTMGMVTAKGFWITFTGASLIGIGALRVFAAGPAISRRSSPLRVALLWNGTVISERLFDEPHDVTVGEDIRSTFVVPGGSGVGKRFTMFRGSRSGRYSMAITREMSGQLSLGGKRCSVHEAIEERTSGQSGSNSVQLTKEDWGIVHVGQMAVFFQFIQAERKVAASFLNTIDSNSLASASLSALGHVALILFCLFGWVENETLKRRPLAFKLWDVEAMFEQIEEEEEEEDEGEEEDTTAKRAEGDEGKFGDPDIDPMIESKVPERDGKMVSKIDPKNVGLVDMLSTQNLAGMGAIANILSADSDGQSNKMAVAMAGAGSEFVMGHGSGGMGFKGTGTGGGGLGGYGRIHGLGRIDTGGGTGMHGSLGRKRARTVGRVRMSGGRTTGFCKRGDIARVVRRRAGAIRSCYQRRLQVKPDLQGKITARWQIKMDGRVGSASAAQDTLRDSAVTGCIMRVLRRMTFPRPEGGVCIIQWPFVFNPN